MLLDGALAQVERARDRDVVLAGGHLAEDRELPLGEGGQRRVVVRGPPGQQRLDHLRVERRSAADHLVQRRDQLLDARHPLLEQVAQPGDTVGKQIDDVVGLDVLRQDDHARPRVPAPDLLGRLDALLAERRRHPQVGEHGIRGVRRDGREQADRLLGHVDDLDPVDLGQQRGGALAHEEVVVGEDDPQRHAGQTAMRVGLGRGLSARA